MSCRLKFDLSALKPLSLEGFILVENLISKHFYIKLKVLVLGRIPKLANNLYSKKEGPWGLDIIKKVKIHLSICLSQEYNEDTLSSWISANTVCNLVDSHCWLASKQADKSLL